MINGIYNQMSGLASSGVAQAKALSANVGLTALAGRTQDAYTNMPDVAKDTLGAGAGVLMLRQGWNTMAKSFSNGPDVDLGNSILFECRGLESKLENLKVLHAEFDTARSVCEKATEGSAKSSPVLAEAEKNKNDALGRFERALGNFEGRLERAHKRLDAANQQRTGNLDFSVGTKDLDIFVYWGEMKDGMASWLQSAKKQAKAEYKTLDFSPALNIASTKDNGKASVLGKAVEDFQAKHTSYERQSPHHSGMSRLVSRAFATTLGVGGAYLVVQKGMTLPGHGATLAGKGFSLVQGGIAAARAYVGV